MNFQKIILILTALAVFSAASQVGAQTAPISVDSLPPDEFSRARVLNVGSPQERTIAGQTETVQNIEVRILTGKEKDLKISIEQSDVFRLSEAQKVKKGDLAVVLKIYGPDEPTYYLTDSYRLPSLAWILAIFFGLVFFFGRWKGFTSMLGLAFSILILALYVVPRILDGAEPLQVILTGARGVLDDTPPAQPAAIEEIRRADPRLSFTELYRRGLSVGREHIASLVNTLALAYAGASLPMFLLFSQDNRQPL